MLSRRELLKRAAQALCLLPLAAVLPSPARLRAALAEPSAVRWGFLVDTRRCVGCGFCVRACKLENEIPYDANVSRTWVERYVRLQDGSTLADTPQAGRDGFTTAAIDLGRGATRPVEPAEISKAFFVPKLCNQCEHPPCVQVCPVGATYQTPQGVTLVDRSWCIGCGYCIMACPYGVRFFHPQLRVADKCTFCYHRIVKGEQPACVSACPFGARQLANLRDGEDAVTRVIRGERVNVLKSEYGTRPQVYYRGLDEEVR